MAKWLKLYATYTFSTLLNLCYRNTLLNTDFQIDMVDHVILVQNLLKLHLHGFIVIWICIFLTGRSQQCKVNGCLSRAVNIGHSIVQGSGIGPMLYVLMKSDLHTLSELNSIFKYADDTTLLVPQHSDIDISDEFDHIKTWALVNKLTLKTKD